MRKRIRILSVLLILCALALPLRVSADTQKLTGTSTVVIATNSAQAGQAGGPQNLFDGAYSDLETDAWFEEGMNLWAAFDIGRESELDTLSLRHLGEYKPFNTAAYSFYVLDESKVTVERVLSLSFAERNALLARSEYWTCLVSDSGNTQSVTSHGLSGKTGRIFKFLVSEPDSYDTEDHVVRVYELELTGTPIVPATDKSALQTAVEDAGMREEEHYTPLSWISFANALRDAVDVMNDPDASQTEINTAEGALIRAEAALVVRADLSELRAMIAELKSLDETAYTAESFGELSLLLQEAEALVADANALQEEADAMLRSLTQRKNALEKITSQEESNPEESSSESKAGVSKFSDTSEPTASRREESITESGNEEESASDESVSEEADEGSAREESSAAKTDDEEENATQGDSWLLLIILPIAAVVCGAVFLLLNKKRKNKS